MIYDFCPNTGRVFPYLWASGAADGSYPPVLLSCVCKTVRMEVELFLYRN